MSTGGAARPAVTTGSPRRSKKHLAGRLDQHLSTVSSRQFFWVTFALFVALGLCWSLATPLFGAPDEPEHVIRAVTEVHGQVLEPQAAHQLGGYTNVRVPATFASGRQVGCYAFYRNDPANSAKFATSHRDIKTVAEYGRYPPAYYAVVGLPSLVSSALRSVYVMRALAVVLVSALLAMGALSIATLPRRRIAAIGYAFAVTPMAVFLGSVVNPSGVEIAAGISLWASGTVLAVRSDGAIDPRLVRRVGIAGAALALCRQLGPLWVAIVVAVMVVLAGKAGTRRLAANRGVRVWGAVVLGAIAAQAVWLAVAGSVNLANLAGASHDPTSLVIRKSIGGSFSFFSQMIGNFGWLDTPTPTGVLVAWAFVLGLLVILGLAWSGRRAAGALAGVLALTVAVPIVLEAASAHSVGYVWQGRYGLPLAVGVPIVAGVLLSRTGNATALSGRVAAVAGAAFFFGQFFSLAQSMRRDMVGYNAKILFVSHAAWSPPVPASLLLVCFIVVLGAATIWLFRMPEPKRTPTTPVRARPAEEPSPVGS